MYVCMYVSQKIESAKGPIVYYVPGGGGGAGGFGGGGVQF